MTWKMYQELASWWPLLSPPEDYEEEADIYKDIFAQEGLPSSPTLLELGSGGGNNAFHLKINFSSVTLVDLSPAMLEISRSLNPQCEHLQGDMRNIRLHRQFDAVFIHDAIGYMMTVHALEQAMQTAWEHCKPGGCVLLAPDEVSETFQPLTEHGGTDGPERSLRYLEWSHPPDPTTHTYQTEYVFVLHQNGGTTHVEHERHEYGLFPRQTWLDCLQKIGFHTRIQRDSFGRDLFIARKPRAAEIHRA